MLSVWVNKAKFCSSATRISAETEAQKVDHICMSWHRAQHEADSFKIYSE